MLKIYRSAHCPKTLYFVLVNLEYVCYKVDSMNRDIIYISYFSKELLNTLTLIEEYEILFNKELRVLINRFLKLSMVKIINNALNEGNRLVLTDIKRRDNLRCLLIGIKRRLKLLVNENICK